MARAINSEVKAGRGSPHGGVFLDICTRRRRRLHQEAPALACTTSSRSWPASTSPRRRWRSGPTMHYVMGGVRVDADSTAATVPGLFAAGEVAGGMHGSNRLGGNSLSDLLVFGRRAGLHAALYAQEPGRSPRPSTRDRWSRSRARCSSPSTRSGGENPYTIQSDLQDTHARPGRHHPDRGASSRKRSRSSRCSSSARRKVRVEGGRTYNPGWHLALDLASLLTVSECCALAALERKESRGGHTRDDYPVHRRHLGQGERGLAPAGRAVHSRREPLPEMPRRAQGPLPGAEVMATNFTMQGVPRRRRGGDFKEYTRRGRARAWWCST